MPQKFTGEISTPTDLRFNADEYVDDRGSLGWLPDAAKNLETVSGSLVLNQAAKAAQAEERNTDEMYSQARRLKQGIRDAVDAEDRETVNKFSSQLQELKIAERRGAITGTNSQIRQDSLLKQYVNRYPHREEEIRKVFSATRAQAQSDREQFKDPIDTGFDRGLENAAAMNMNPVDYFKNVQQAQELETKSKNLEMRAKLGVNIENDVEAMFDSNVVSLEFTAMNNFLEQQINEAASKGSDFNKDKTMADLQNLKQQALIRTSASLNQMKSKAGEPDAVMSRDFISAQRDKIAKMYDERMATLKGFDTLEETKRYLELGKYKTLSELRSIDPMWRVAIDAQPSGDKAVEFISKDWQTYRDMNKAGFRYRNEVLLKNATDPAERARLKTQQHLYDAWQNDPNQQAEDVGNAIKHGEPPQSTGIPEVDAAKVNTLTGMLNSKNLEDSSKVNVAKSALKAEKIGARPGEYVGPGTTWYKNPTKAEFVRKNPEIAKTIRTEIDNGLSGLIRGSNNAEDLNSIRYNPNPEGETDKEPWKSYQTGGPFASSMSAERLKNVGSSDSQFSLSFQSGADNWKESLHAGTYVDKMVKSLNTSYWNIRNAEGSAAADSWYYEVVEPMLTDHATKLTGTKKPTKDAPVEIEDDGTAVHSLDVTD